MAAILINREKDPSGVHLIMGDNFSDEGTQIGPTPWILAHRFIHSITLNYPESHLDKITETLSNSLGYLKKLNVFYAGLTFNSAKIGKLMKSEIYTEMSTQYIVTGKIDYNFEKAAAFYHEIAGSDPYDFFPKWPSFEKRYKLAVNALINSIKDQVDKSIDKTKGKIYYI